MENKKEEEICPLCGKENNCQHGSSKCWCHDIKVPKGLIDLLPEHNRGKACICKSCIDKYTNV